ncbi:MAG TPA: murein L,D-transpeptidase catalytic domain family protein, partial [Chitinophagaceae bacterium]
KRQLLSISFLLLLPPAGFKALASHVPAAKNKTISTDNTAEALYSQMNLAEAGLSKAAFDYAYKGYRYLLKHQKLGTPGILTICDMSQSSVRRRLYILDMNENRILYESYVAHGKGSGMEYATRFSNRANSHQSSLGFYITGNTYVGEHGLSLRLRGLEAGFNDHATRRNIVVHGADYIGNANPDNRFMGRSYGCPAVPQAESQEIIDLIKNGTCLFIYHPNTTYFKRSKILNG